MERWEMKDRRGGKGLSSGLFKGMSRMRDLALAKGTFYAR
jgi:hypothetical protein